MKRNDILFLLLLVGQFCWAITGRIVDEKAKPLNQVAVSSENKVVFSNENGYFYLPVNTVRDSLHFYKFGYKEKILPVHFFPETVILEKKTFELETFYVQEKRDVLNPFQGTKKEIVNVETNEQRSLAQLLNEKANLSLLGEKLAGENQQISIFGSKAKHTLILLDGIPLNKSGEAFDISSIPTNLIEKIEIIPHGSSSMGGSGAIGGAINFITRKENDNSISYQQLLGSFGLHSEKLQLNVNYRNLFFSQNLTLQDAKNDFSYQYLFSDSLVWKKRENNRKKSFDSFSQIRFYPESGEWRLQVSYQDFYKGLPGPTNQLSKFDNCHLDGTVKRFFLEQKNQLNKILWQSKAFYFDEKTVFDNRFSSSGSYRIKAITEYDKYGAQLNFKKTKTDNWNLFFELNQEAFQYHAFNANGETLSGQSIAKVKRTNWSPGGALFFTQKFFPLEFKEHFSVRYDQFSDSNSNHDDKLSLRCEITLAHENLLRNELHFIIGNAFSVPSFYDLYWKGDFQTVGNPDLKPEQSRDWQISWKTEYEVNSISVSYHFKRIEDMIYWRQSLSNWKPDNLGTAEIKNLRLEANLFPLSWLKMNASYLRTSALDKTKMGGMNGTFYDKNIIYTPVSQIVINGEIFLKKWQISASYLRTGKQWVTQDNLFGTLPAYEIVNVSMQRNVSFNKWDFHFFLQGNNLLNEKYEVYTRMPKAGFHWQSGMQVKYGF
jgi:vitamin B12 transporter